MSPIISNVSFDARSGTYRAIVISQGQGRVAISTPGHAQWDFARLSRALCQAAGV